MFALREHMFHPLGLLQEYKRNSMQRYFSQVFLLQEHRTQT